MILLLGGTSDSRELARSLDAAGHQVLVTTVSEYGGMLAGESGLHQVLTGALDADGLDEMLRQYQVRILVDATHPYAGQISGLAMEAAERAGIRYCRFER
ncbi:MAG TPA: precorrin-6A/cobalt-precorrin-6A reductase, partial [Bacillota bacterium]|nr:precorrin-6A/cobalt-precorrin-6A reductase [Bacillota bacterium]